MSCEKGLKLLASGILAIGVVLTFASIPLAITSFAYSSTDLFYASSDERVYTISQLGGASVPFGTLPSGCTPIGLVAAQDAGGVITGCWSSETLEVLQMLGGGGSSAYTNLPLNCQPEGILLAPDSFLYVACDMSNDLVKVSAKIPHTSTIVANLAAGGCSRPQGIALDPSAPSRLIISCYDSDKLVQVVGGLVSDYVIMPTACGPIGVTYAKTGELLTVCSKTGPAAPGDRIYRNQVANGAVLSREIYATLPAGCVGWGIVQLTDGQFAGDFVVGCRNSGIWRIPTSGSTPFAATMFSNDSPSIPANFIALASVNSPGIPLTVVGALGIGAAGIVGALLVLRLRKTSSKIPSRGPSLTPKERHGLQVPAIPKFLVRNLLTVSLLIVGLTLLISGAANLLNLESSLAVVLAIFGSLLLGVCGVIVLRPRRDEVVPGHFCMLCGSRIGEKDVTCPSCRMERLRGGEEVRSCIHCSKGLPVEAKFCSDCGGAQPSAK